MSKASDRVIAGFIRLTVDERSDVLKTINNYMEKDYFERQKLKESFEKTAGIVLGPIGGGDCPCCGR